MTQTGSSPLRLRNEVFPSDGRPLADAAKVFAHDMARAVIDPLRKSEAVRNGLRGLIYGRKANYYLETGKGSGA